MELGIRLKIPNNVERFFEENLFYREFPQVITSKQRPRKLTILGGDGRKYMFLLKGHEDLRQDERVMQFFRDALRSKIFWPELILCLKAHSTKNTSIELSISFMTRIRPKQSFKIFC